ncbi:Gryzun, putative trafficking through golgi-domain-containing protein [Lentinula aciculospora]|uniref:Gryzun, putative trafficking through golgi-domain-containing protein n=1 Tax=Lentinula aciculospora TaxID=153920 RepID=A0A9W9DTG3_9AGAR|nr:Gryzun, putative trafficking through golgi-domain-containing protein [Lentinula aciculospora]
MNSYPLELIAQLAPVMFVAGLNTPPSHTTNNIRSNSTSPPQPPPPTHHSRNPSLTTLTGVSGVPGVDNPTNTFLPLSLPTQAHAVSMTPRADPFTILQSRLRDILIHQRKITVWDAPTAEKAFQVVLVDKDLRFPPRKVDSTATASAAGAGAAHSPLSPLTPSSPLHPDGLIAPIWIRKHTMLLPAVFVLFIRLFEVDDSTSYYAYSVGTEHNAEFEQRLKDLRDLSDKRSHNDKDPAAERIDRVKELERLKDSELASLIALRKRSTNERGIKLTVVLLASRKLLDDSASGAGLGLDTRLTFIRRQSGLDSRAALFVLSPIPKDELEEFVKSLQTALWDPAVEYYTAHSKRVRQKRNRHQAQSAQSHRRTPSIITSSSSSNSMNTLNSMPSLTTTMNLAPLPILPLKPEGWTVRYEYKMASFAEFRGEHEVALKHYQDAYAALTMLFMAPGSSLGMASGAAGVSMPLPASTSITSTSSPPSMTTNTSNTSSNTSSTSNPTNASTTSNTSSNGGTRTKRWAEAKVLADTINIKIVKLYLYNNETGLALAQQRLHVRTFPVVAGFTGGSTGMSNIKSNNAQLVGSTVNTPTSSTAEEGSYEYWSWVSRMWCVFAEMLVEGTRARGPPSALIPPNLVIPIHRPRLPPPSTSSVPGVSGKQSPSSSPSPELLLLQTTGAAPGVNPAHALMHPGWYYFLAAECAERKVGRFVDGIRNGVELNGEKERDQKIVHLRALVGDVLELYTKSYELFKLYSTNAAASSASSHAVNASISNPGDLTTIATSTSSASNTSNTSNTVNVSNPAKSSTAGSGTGRLALYIAHRIALTYARFPDPNFPSKPRNVFKTTEVNPAEQVDLDNTTDELEPLSSFFVAIDGWEQRNGDSQAEDLDSLMSLGDEAEGGNFRGKDPEKLGLAARFLARIAKSYWREGSSSSSISSGSASLYPGGSTYPGGSGPMYPAYPTQAGYLSYPNSKYNTYNGQINGDEEDEAEKTWGWPALLVPLLRTWCSILKELVGRGVRDVRETRDNRDLKGSGKPSEKLPETLLEKLEILETLLESYIRVLISRIGVDRDVEFSRKKEEMEIQREVRRAVGVWVGVQGLRVAKASTSKVGSFDGVPKIETLADAKELGNRETKVIRIDNTDTQPIFDTSVVFWYSRIWVSSIHSLRSTVTSASTLPPASEFTPFQVTLTAPTRVAIDKLDWAELRVNVVFEYEGYESERDEDEQEKDDGETEEEQEQQGVEAVEPASKMELRTQEIEVVIRPNFHFSENIEDHGADEPVRTIDVGHLSFGEGFSVDRTETQTTSHKQGKEKFVSGSLRWIHGQTVVLTGSVGVRASADGGIGQGRVRISSLVLRLNAPTPLNSSSSPASSVSLSAISTPVLVIPLHVPARRGASHPLTSFAGNDGTPVNPALHGNHGTQTTSVQLQAQAMWFAGFVEIQRKKESIEDWNKAKIPRWVPVSRKGDEKGSGYGSVDISHRPHSVTLSISHSGVAYVGEEYPVDIVVRGCRCDSGAQEVQVPDDGEGTAQESRDEVEVVMDVLLQPVESDVTAVNTISIGPDQSNTMIREIPLGSMALHSHVTSELKTTLWIKNTGGAGDRVVDMSIRTRPIRRRKPNKSRTKSHRILHLPHLETETLETLTIPCIEPFSVEFDVGYRRCVDPSLYSTLNPGKDEVGLWDRPKKALWLDDEKQNEDDQKKNENNENEEAYEGDLWAERVESDVEAVVRATFGCVDVDRLGDTGSTGIQEANVGSVASLGVEVEKVALQTKDSQSPLVRILSSEMFLESEEASVNNDEDEAHEEELRMFPLEFLPNDELSDVCRIGISAHRDDEDGLVGADGELEIPSPGSYVVYWRRILPNDTRGALSSTTFPLPSLRPPTDSLVALLDVSPTAKLHEPLTMSLTIRNRHPTRTADVYVQLEFPPGTSGTSSVGGPGTVPTTDIVAAGISMVGDSASQQDAQNTQLSGGSGFVVSGLRAGRVPLLLAGTEERLVWMLIPIECGFVRLPKIRVVDRRKAVKGTAGMLGGGASGGTSRLDLRTGGATAAAGAEVDNDGLDAEGGKEVKVVDIRLEERKGLTKRETGMNSVVEIIEGQEERGKIGSVLVLP